MPTPGPLELVIILVIALLILGPGRLPDVGSALGKSLREFRKASSDIQDAVKIDTSPLPPDQAAATTPAAPPAAVAPVAAAPLAAAPAPAEAPAATAPTTAPIPAPVAADAPVAAPPGEVASVAATPDASSDKTGAESAS
jgi:TatA/E family protein of Tat protein translocase